MGIPDLARVLEIDVYEMELITAGYVPEEKVLRRIGRRLERLRSNGPFFDRSSE